MSKPLKHWVTYAEPESTPMYRSLCGTSMDTVHDWRFIHHYRSIEASLITPVDCPGCVLAYPLEILSELDI